MKRMKSFWGLIVPLIVPVSLAACGGDEPGSSDAGKDKEPAINATASTAGLDKYSEANIFSRNVELPVRVPMQGFSLDSDGSVWYTVLYDTELYISKGRPNKSAAVASAKTEFMKLTYFGHGTNTAIEEDGNDRYIWAGCYGTCNSSGAYWTERLISRTKFVAGSVVPTDKCDDYYYIGDYYNVQPTIDVEHDQLAIQYDGSGGGTVNFVVYKLSEAKKAPMKTVEVKCTDGFLTGNNKSTTPVVTKVQVHDLTAIKPVASPKCPWKNNPALTYYPWQGYDVNGNRLYFVEGAEGKPSYAYLTVYDMSGRVVESRTRIKAVADKTFTNSMGISVSASMESEGVKVKNGKIYFGFSNRWITEGNSAYYQTIFMYDKPTR